MCPPDPGCPLRFGWRDAGEAKGTGEGPRHPPPPRNVPRFAFELPAGGLRPRRVSPHPPPPALLYPILRVACSSAGSRWAMLGRMGFRLRFQGFYPFMDTLVRAPSVSPPPRPPRKSMNPPRVI